MKKLNVGFPFSTTNDGGSYVSSAEIIRSMKNDIKSYVFLPFKGHNHKLFIGFENCIIYDFNPKFVKRLVNSSGVIKKLLSITAQFKIYKKALDIFSKYDLDIIHINDDLSVLPWSIAAKKFNIKVIWHVRQPSGNRLLDFYRLKRIDFLIFNSSATERRFYKSSGKPSKVIYNPISLNRFNKIESSNSQIHDEKSKIVITFIGSLQKRKRPEFLLRFISEFTNHELNIVFLIIGRDYKKGDYLKKIAKLNNEKLKNISIEYYESYNPIEKVYQYTDILVVPSKKEAFGRVVLEASASSIPVVASNIGGIPEIVVHEKSGYLFPVESYEKFSEYLNTLIKNTELRILMGKKAREIVSKKFSEDKSMKEIENIYFSMFRIYEENK